MGELDIFFSCQSQSKKIIVIMISPHLILTQLFSSFILFHKRGASNETLGQVYTLGGRPSRAMVRGEGILLTLISSSLTNSLFSYY